MGGLNFLYVLPMVISSLVGVVGVVFGGVMTYKANKRTSSGTVATSNAMELWAENSRLVDRLTKEIDRLTGDVDNLRQEVTKLRGERDDLRKENTNLRQKQHELEIEVIKLQSSQITTKSFTTTETVGGTTDASIH